MYPIELKTVRPFIYSELLLKAVDEIDEDVRSRRTNDLSSKPSELTMEIVRDKLEEMIAEAKSLGTILYLITCLFFVEPKGYTPHTLLVLR